MTETELLADLATRFERVSETTEIAHAEDDKGVTTKIINVFETKDAAYPLAICRNVMYYVLDSGKETESAYYHPVIENMIESQGE